MSKFGYQNDVALFGCDLTVYGMYLFLFDTLFAEIRPRHSAPSPATLAEGAVANRLQAGCPCLQIPAWISPTVPR